MEIAAQLDARSETTLGRERRVFHLTRFAIYGLQVCALAGVASAFYFEGLSRLTSLVATLVVLVAGIVINFVVDYLRRAQMVHHRRLLNDSARSQWQIEQLFALTDTLQSADTNQDAANVLKSVSRRLLPGCGGALYVFNNSRDRLDLVDSWSMPAEYIPAESLTPANCWALKRGKDHLNEPHPEALCCSHYIGEVASIEVPMLARGSVYGLLVLTDRDGECANVEKAQRIARALADTTSLALSNISLREQLRTQSLRDPMTGLYNRRYMEDALERFATMARRKDQSTAAVMIDLDNFKALNDEHGHAKGDAVLKDVATQLVGLVRPSDIVCRYGGEELLVILPECSIGEAKERAEQMRVRIKALSEIHACEISASFGVSAIGETAETAMELLSTSDNALYAAKADGKDRVRVAPPVSKQSASPKLVANA
ncbi:sensor domain-containing diguanylate cyclase [Aurantiacibacter spongiae]|uniref:diguanylate cyclase n=1 Tax=Aurantiacibacter spongiae TaxID=2488860 RepID=A0A3N5CUR2_9SPHN|nr:sensor domain-containing diguanylate cyclase [Aurantiacibacter spongiae]RPF72467.1 sensor domain-containing diguanylate cyclase [Aurantiacibacter spongiae]